MAGKILTKPPRLSNWATAFRIILDTSDEQCRDAEEILLRALEVEGVCFFGKVLLRPSAEQTLRH